MAQKVLCNALRTKDKRKADETYNIEDNEASEEDGDLHRKGEGQGAVERASAAARIVAPTVTMRIWLALCMGKKMAGISAIWSSFLKRQDGSYNLMEIYSDKKENLTAKSFFKTRKGISQRAMLLNESSTLTSVTAGATLLDGTKLPKFFENPTIAEEESIGYRFREGETM